MNEETFFKLPTEPEEFGVVLTPSKLRRIDFSALEFDEINRAIVEYVKTYYPDQFNDFVASNGAIMFMELVSYIGALLSSRSDVLVEESFLPTAKTFEAVQQHLTLINNSIKRATPAIVDIEVSIPAALPTNVEIPAGIVFTLDGSDGEPVFYELYRAPGDFTNPIIIPAGSRGIIGFGIEGRFATPFTFESVGGLNQKVEILGNNILSDPIIVTVTSGSISEQWKRVESLDSQTASDKVFKVTHLDDRIRIEFGDNRFGQALLAGQNVEIRYRVGGGSRGRIRAGAINETRPVVPKPPLRSSIEVLFRNITPSSGGTDTESLQAAKLRAPLESAASNAATTGNDYAVIAKSFSHPIFGDVSKAVASLKTSLNANIVFLHILAVGPGGVPVLPSAGLKQGLKEHLDNIKVLTDEVRVVDAVIKPIDVRANVVVSANADPSIVKVNIDKAINDFFSIDKFDLGQPLYIAQLINTLQNVDGVRTIQLLEPVDDILASKNVSDKNFIRFDELITLGNINIKLYAEKV